LVGGYQRPTSGFCSFGWLRGRKDRWKVPAGVLWSVLGWGVGGGSPRSLYQAYLGSWSALVSVCSDAPEGRVPLLLLPVLLLLLLLLLLLPVALLLLLLVVRYDLERSSVMLLPVWPLHDLTCALQVVCAAAVDSCSCCCFCTSCSRCC
jgi:hypothetical protein